MRKSYLKSLARAFYRSCAVSLILAFLTSLLNPAMVLAQTPRHEYLPLPDIGERVPLSEPYAPTLIKGLKVFPKEPLRLDFIVDTGDSGLEETGLRSEADRMIKYFLATLTTPDEDLWVNLAPYEKDRIIAPGFGQTLMGRDLLAQDYLLKQIAASLMYPEKKIGERFWERVYEKIYARYGSVPGAVLNPETQESGDVPGLGNIDTFNKVWITPKKAVVYANPEEQTVYVMEAELQVMLEQDYVAAQAADKKRFAAQDAEPGSVTTDILREIIIPELEQEVNHGANFTLLRQIYHAMILASWYKQNLKQSLLGQSYVGKNKVEGVDVVDKQIKEKIYARYLRAFKTGVYDYIKEEYDFTTQTVIPRKYFSGGVAVMDVAAVLKETGSAASPGIDPTKKFIVSADIVPERQRLSFDGGHDPDFAQTTDHAYSRIRLENGPAVLAPLDPLHFRQEVEGNDYFRIAHELSTNAVYGWASRPEERGYTFFDTPLAYLQRSLDVDVVEGVAARIREVRSSLRADKIVTIVDWGCGGGKSLDELITALEDRGVDLANVRFVGFSDFYSRQWKQRDRRITFILDEALHFDKYFHDGEIDFLFSHLGLAHVKFPAEKKRVMERLLSTMDPQGMLVQDYFIASSRVSAPEKIPEGIPPWLPEGYRILRNEPLSRQRALAVLQPKQNFSSEVWNHGNSNNAMWWRNHQSREGILNYLEARQMVEAFFVSPGSEFLRREFGDRPADVMEAMALLLKAVARLEPDEAIPETIDPKKVTRRELFPDKVDLALPRSPQQQTLLRKVLVSRMRYERDKGPLIDDAAMTVNHETARVALLPARPGLAEVLNQPVFPEKFDRELISYLEDEVVLDNGVRIALNWVGIHDGIRIEFLPRDSFEANKEIFRERDQGQGQPAFAAYMPFYKDTRGEQLTYVLPEDVSVNEIRLFMEELSAFIPEEARSLQLSEEAAERFENMAVFLAKQKVREQLDGPARRHFEQQVELLHALGGLLRNQPRYTSLGFEDIQKLNIDFYDDNTALDLYGHLSHFLHLSEYSLKDPDTVRWWSQNADRYIQSMYAIAMREKFEYVIFQKGIEELTQIGTRYSEALEPLAAGTSKDEQQLWAQLPFERWRRLAADQDKDQEQQIILEMQEYVRRYKGWVVAENTDYSPFYAKITQELNCLGRSCLIARILKEIGYTEDRIFLGSYIDHSFVMVELSDGSYFNIQTYRDPSGTTGPIPTEILPLHFLSGSLAHGRSLFLSMDKKDIPVGSPIRRAFSAHKITEGLMSSLLGNLLWDIYESRARIAGADKLELLDFVIAGFQKILRFDKNDFNALQNLASAYLQKGEQRYATARNIADLKDAVRLIENAYDYQKQARAFTPHLPEITDSLAYCRLLLKEYRAEVRNEERSAAVNVSGLDKKLEAIAGLNAYQRKAFRQYLIDKGLYKYENLIGLFNAPTIDFLLKDPSVKPVFLEVLTSQHREGLFPFDKEAISQLGRARYQDGMRLLDDHLGFRVGVPQEADYLLTVDPSRQIIAGIASNISVTGKRMNPHGRQSFILLNDGSLLGLKGSGQNLDEQAPSIEWDEVKDRYSGIMSVQDAQIAAKTLKHFQGTQARLMQYLGYASVHAVPGRDGDVESLDALLHDRGKVFKSAVGLYRVATPHRLSEFRRLLSQDPGLRNTRELISRGLVAIGRLPEGTVLSAEELIRHMVKGFGETEAIKHNKGWIKFTFHQQDLLLSGDESDNEEFIRNADPTLQLRQMRVKVMAVAMMVGSIRQMARTNSDNAALLADKDSAYRVLREMMNAYFEALEKPHLRQWIKEEYAPAEANPWEVVFGGVPLERFYVTPTSGGSDEMLEKKLFMDMTRWAREAYARKGPDVTAGEDVSEDFAQAADINIPHFFHATNLRNLVRMMRIGKIPAVGQEKKRVYLNEAKKESPGYFGNIIFYIDHAGLKENGIDVYRIPGTPYYESRQDIPFERITRVEFARVQKDPLLILELDKEAGHAGVSNEATFIQSRDILLSLIYPELDHDERQARIAALKQRSERSLQEFIERSPDRVSIVGLPETISRDQLRDFVDSGHIIRFEGNFYLVGENDQLRKVRDRAGDVTDQGTTHKVFQGDLQKFTRLTEEDFFNSFFDLLRQEGALFLSEAEIRRLTKFAQLLREPKSFQRVIAAETLTELKAALAKDEDYPFVAYDAAYHAQRILEQNGFSSRLTESRNKETGDFYYFTEVDILGRTLIVDLVADQFELRQSPDRARMRFQTEYEDLGVVVLPQQIVASPENRDKVPMYATWETREVNTDFAMTTNFSPDTVGGIDLNPALLDLQNTQGWISLDAQSLLYELDNVKGFSPVILQITPATY